MSWQLATFAGLALVLVGGFWLVRALAAAAPGWSRWSRRWRRSRSPGGWCWRRSRTSSRPPTSPCSPATRSAPGPGSRSARWRRRSPTSGSARGRGRPGRWRAGGWSASAARGWRSLTGRRLGRLGLAAACALAGLAYGALLDLSVMVTYGGEQSLDRYLALSARGIPFNVAHAVGNFAIALAAGPGAGADDLALSHPARVHLARRAGALPLVAAGAASPPSPALGRSPRAGAAGGAGAARRPGSSARRTPTAASRATPGQPSSPAMTGWAMLGLEAAGRNPLDVRARRRDAGRLPALAGRPAALGRRPRAHDPRARRRRASTRAASPAPTWSPSCARAATATARSTARST